MLTLAKRVKTVARWLEAAGSQVRGVRTEARSPRWRSRSPAMAMRKAEEKSEWWIVDGEMHELGDHVPPRERFVIPRNNIPNKRRKQLREQFMRRTRLVLKETHEPWCKKYMELRENWERLYWDEGYSKKIARDHANYESAEDDDQDFNPYRSKQSHFEQVQDHGVGNGQGDTWEKVNQIRDKFEHDRERRMKEKAFAPMHGEVSSSFHDTNSRRQPFDRQRYFSESDRVKFWWYPSLGYYYRASRITFELILVELKMAFGTFNGLESFTMKLRLYVTDFFVSYIFVALPSTTCKTRPYTK